jgi:hypothetical protein
MKNKIVFFIGSDFPTTLMLNQVIPFIADKGLSVELFYAQSKANPNLNKNLFENLFFYEKTLPNEVIFPFLEEHKIEKSILSPKQLSEKYGFQIHSLENVNDTDFIEKIQSDESVIGGISIRCYQKFSKEIIGVFYTKGFFWNLHPGKLPEFRGVIPPFRVMLSSNPENHWTLHTIDTEFDTGPIIDVRSQPYNNEKSLLETYIGLAPLGAEILMDNLHDYLSSNSLTSTEQDDSKAHYYTYPNQGEIQTAHNIGIRLAASEKMTRYYLSQFCDFKTPLSFKLQEQIINAVADWERTRAENVQEVLRVA